MKKQEGFHKYKCGCVYDIKSDGKEGYYWKAMTTCNKHCVDLTRGIVYVSWGYGLEGTTIIPYLEVVIQKMENSK